MNHQFLVMWCNQGLEYIVDVTAAQQRTVWEKLRGELPSESGIANIEHLKLRARYNPQRHYEIYAVDAVAGVTESDIRTMFKNDPQGAADMIRDRGYCLHSDRAEEDHVVIR